jgi:tRNA pseudouridine(38-40) synthase
MSGALALPTSWLTQTLLCRFGARYREYKYFMTQDSQRPLNIAAMQQAAGYLVGEHDFRNFCKMDVEHVLTFRLPLPVQMRSAAPRCFTRHHFAVHIAKGVLS